MLDTAYSIEGGGQKHKGARHITGNVLILLKNLLEDYSIQEPASPHSSFPPSLSPFNLLLSLFYYFNFLFNSGSVFTKQELLINTSSSSL